MNQTDVYLLTWKPTAQRPREGSYVLLKCLEDGEIYSCGGSYEQGEFWYSYDREHHRKMPEAVILGWDYYPYNE